MMYRILKILLPLFLPFVVSAGYAQPIPETDSLEVKKNLAKIKLDLDQIDENGLTGPPDGKRLVAYEFCIPIDKKKRRKVRRIDPSVRFHLGSQGRSGCGGQYLCIGEGGNKKVLLKLAKLEYVKEINPCYWE